MGIIHDGLANVVVGADKLASKVGFQSTITPEQQAQALTPQSGLLGTFEKVYLPNDGLSSVERGKQRLDNVGSNLSELGNRIGKFLTGNEQTRPLNTTVDGAKKEIGI